jgi:hypothetical protein
VAALRNRAGPIGLSIRKLQEAIPVADSPPPPKLGVTLHAGVNAIGVFREIPALRPFNAFVRHKLGKRHRFRCGQWPRLARNTRRGRVQLEIWS